MSDLGGIPIMARYADMSNTIPDEKVVITYVTYLCARLLDIRHETRAARVIQAAWRNYRTSKTERYVKVRNLFKYWTQPLEREVCFCFSRSWGASNFLQGKRPNCKQDSRRVKGA